ASFVMDDDHLLAAARYIELNPVRAKIVRKPHRYRYSSARAHLEGRDDRLLTAAPLLKMIPDWPRFLGSAVDPQEQELLRSHERTGRPLGSKRFVSKLERLLGRPLHPRKGGRPPKKKN
ncbi:MAG: transposase, partial [Candidatus Nealsonbacteria bacterium]|nr:transposase [Candidatus Nealsonbacteria bacterium]